jgi:hypothetical protein
MSNIIDFKPLADLLAAKQLDAFIAWAQATLPKGIPNQVHESIRWDMNSWHQSGMKGVAFTALASPRHATVETRLVMQPPFIDFAKALLVYRSIFLGKKAVKDWLVILKCLEVALVELTGDRDVTQVSAAVCNRACEHIQVKILSGENAYIRGKYLEQIIKLMREKELLAKPFSWVSPIKRPAVVTLKQQKRDRETKLASRESINALGELFSSNLTNPLDVVVTSACALLLSTPGRIGELADVELDCIVFKDGVDDNQRMFLRWYAEKGFGAQLKPVMTGMEPAVERLIERLRPITDEAREYAGWLEEHPNEFPPHEGVPKKELDDPLSYAEACAALKLSWSNRTSPRMRFKLSFFNPLIKYKSLGSAAQAVLNEIQEGWDLSKGKRVYGKGSGVHGYEFDDKALITLRKLNILVRDKYLPKDFPYTKPYEDGKKRVKYRDALFTIRTGALVAEDARGKLIDFGVEIAANKNRMTIQLSGSGKTKSIFERHGYTGVRVNTHAFRHELNTEMHRASLSQLLIDAFSGRTSMGYVYNHETVEARTQAVAEVHPKTKQSNAVKRLEKVKTNAPLGLSDVIDLEEGDQDRVVHQTHLGICVHNFASEPCPKMGACLTCGLLGCVKGDDVKLANIKEERAYLQERYRSALAAESREEIGATEWVKKVSKDLLKCDALVKLLESPQLEKGDIVWNADSGWNLTNNAAAMAGLIDLQVIEVKDQEALPSLDELSAIMDEIEV